MSNSAGRVRANDSLPSLPSGEPSGPIATKNEKLTSMRCISYTTPDSLSRRRFHGGRGKPRR